MFGLAGMRFKKVVWNWTSISLVLTIHKGRNPVSGKRFMYIGIGPFLGFDFYWPEDTVVGSHHFREGVK